MLYLCYKYIRLHMLGMSQLVSRHTTASCIWNLIPEAKTFECYNEKVLKWVQIIWKIEQATFIIHSMQFCHLSRSLGEKMEIEKEEKTKSEEKNEKMKKTIK